MQKNKVIIIGGGYAGLAAGCYLQMNGFETKILEKDSICGGISVAWQRKGFTFDGATNYLPGSSPDFNIYHIINEILDFSKLDIYNYKEFICVEHDNEKFHVYTNANRLKKEMLRLAPNDGKLIDDFIRAIKKFGTFSLPFEKAPELFTIFDGIKFLSHYLPLIFFRFKWGRITIDEFARKFKSPIMQKMFTGIFPHHEYFATMAPIAPLGWMNAKKAGYPMGGSTVIIKLFLERYLSLGGTIENKQEVTKINVEQGVAKSVTCIDKKRYAADFIVSSGDLHNAMFTLLDSKHIDSITHKRFNRLRPFSAIIQVSLGIKRLFDSEPEKLFTDLSEELTFGNHTTKKMMVRICSFDSSFAPKGSTSVIVQLRNEESKYWQNLRDNNMKKYNVEKKRVANIVIDSLEKRFGNIKKNIKVVDVATPATFTRYTNLWKGAHQGWAPTPNAIGRLQSKTLPNVKNFYFTGQWLSPGGGIPATIALSRQVAQLICKKTGKTFQTKKA